MDIETISHEAFNRAVIGQSLMNYPAIFQGFLAMGIPESEIRPRENVLTFWAWKAIGRRVKKGEHGVKATTFIDVTRKVSEREPDDSAGRTFRVPRSVTVFHISQTEIDPKAGRQ